MTYVGLDGPELLNECGDNAQKWAQAFMELVYTRAVTVDEGLMISWFANAIERTRDLIHQKQRLSFTSTMCDECSKIEGMVYIHSKCHPESPTWVCIDRDKSEISIRCAECNKIVLQSNAFTFGGV